MKLSVIIPVFNEKRTVEELVARVLKEETPKEIIIVDDGSTDGSREIIAGLKGKNLRKIYLQSNEGKGAAVREGIKLAQGEVLLIQDADLEYDPQYYQQLLEPIKNRKAKVVYGSRLKSLKLRLWGKNKTPFCFHYLANRFLSVLTNFLYRSNLTDMETGYKVLTKEVYRRLNLMAFGFEIEPEITAKILRLGYQIVEVPISTRPRSYDEGKKIKTRDAFCAFWALLKCRWP